MKKQISRILSLVLLVAMVMSLMPTTLAFAEEAPEEEIIVPEEGVILPVTGEGEQPGDDPEDPFYEDELFYEDDLDAVTDEADLMVADDVDGTWELITGTAAEALDEATLYENVAITMTASDGTTYALTNTNGTGAAPTAAIVTVTASGDVTTMAPNSAANSTISWTAVEETDDTGAVAGYSFHPNGNSAKWLYSNNANNGVRVGTNTNKVWTLADGYLFHAGTSRYMGVYKTNPDWRAYTSINDNIKNQTLRFWVFVESDEPVDPTPTAPATPTASPAPGAVAEGTEVTISCATAGATIPSTPSTRPRPSMPTPRRTS